LKDTLIDWLGTFGKVLTLPTPDTFLAEAKKANGKFASAVGWLVFYAVYIYVLASILIGKMLSIPALLMVVLVIPVVVILATTAMNFIFQRAFHRKEYLYDKILYITVAVLFPVFFILTFLSLFIPGPIFAILAFILLFYQVALLTIGMKTIADIEYWQALVTVLLSIIVGILAGAIVFLSISATIAPPRLIKSP
jgi:hypothetical protein